MANLSIKDLPSPSIVLTPLRIAVIYLGLGIAFLYLSDVLFVRYLTEPLLSQIQALKGIVEVFLTAGLIFVLTRHSQRQLQETNSELRRQSDLVNVLSRVLRHNLRNDLNVIRGHLTMAAEDVSESNFADDTLVGKIDELVELADTARQIESIANSDPERQPVELSTLVENVIEDVESTHPGASFSIDTPGDVYVEAYPTLRTVLEELIENAAKHSPDSPSVTIVIEEAPDAVEIAVIDTGPGLPTQEQEVLQAGKESPLSHASGLGLWVSNWIINSHNGSIQTDVNDDGTQVTVSLPPNSSASSECTAAQTLLTRFNRERDKFEALFEESLDPILIVDDEGRYVDVNERAGDLIGLPKQELQGRHMRDFVPDEVDFDAAWNSLLDSGRDRGTAPLKRADGTERVVEHSIVTDIVPGHHLIVFRDVTERNEQEEQLRETTERLEAIVSASPDPVVALDTDMTIQLWNEGAENVFGYRADAVIGEPVPELDLHTDDEVPTAKKRFQRALAGETFTGLEVRRRTQDGSELHLSVSTAPLRDEEGEVDGIIVIAKDITERVQRERQYIDFFENAAVPMHWVGPNGTILHANQAELDALGYSREEYVGTHIADFHADQAAIDEILERLSSGEELEEYRARMECKDGSIREVLINSSVNWKDSEFVNTRCVTRDITGYNEREQEIDRLGELYREVERIADIGAWEVTENGDCRWTPGTRRIHGVSQDLDPTIEEVIEYFHPQDRDAVRSGITNALESGEPYTLRARLLTEDGDQRWVRTHGEPVSDSGTPTTVRGYIQDITEQTTRS